MLALPVGQDDLFAGNHGLTSMEAGWITPAMAINVAKDDRATDPRAQRKAAARRLSKLTSGNSEFAGSRILVIPLDIGLVLAGPFFVDFDEDCADEAQQAVFAGEDPDFDGASFDLLLDGTLDRV